jgi:tetratricopeptide (TPR) repeat protein
MVAKALWPILIGISILLSACQTVAPASDAAVRKNEPEDVFVPQNSEEVPAVTETKDSGNKTPPKKPLKIEPDTASEQVPERVQPEPSPALVVTRLQQEALQLQSEGRWSEAELKLERALRIDAEKVDIYHQLATVRMGQDRFTEAEQIALKGLSMTDQTPKYKSALWEVISFCRSALGDIKGAKEARAEMLQWMELDQN